MDRASHPGMSIRNKLLSECHDLRAQLKEWEKSFAQVNSGRKPGKEDIKKDPKIAAKYKTYNRTRDVLEGKKDPESLRARSPSLRRRKSSPSLKRCEPDQEQVPQRTIFATPRKLKHSISESHPSILDPYDAPPASLSPHPYVFKNAIGPTPQRDGRILGLFDLLSNSGSTPSTRKRKADALTGKQYGMNVARTPSKKSTKANEDILDHLGEVSGGRRHSRTPASDGKKFLLSQFFATPSTVRFGAIAEDDTNDAIEGKRLDQTPLRSRVLAKQAQSGPPNESALETTPAYLRRTTSFNQRLFNASISNPHKITSNASLTFTSPTAVQMGPQRRPFKGKALSEILKNLRQMEDKDDEDEMDALREIGGNEMNVQLGDCQDILDTSTTGEGPTRTWKKKGQKRTTRRVIMRPTTIARKPSIAGSENGHDCLPDVDVTKVDETQISAPADEEEISDLEDLLEEDNDKENHNGRDPLSSHAYNSTDSASDPDSDYDELASSPPPKKRKLHASNPESQTKPPPATSSSKAVKTSRHTNHPSQTQPPPSTKETTKDKKKKNPKQKGTTNPNAPSHLNFRSLKIRNKNSKAGGRGRFGKGRR
jgi:DNA replication and checkpoint protein